jgi:hypothetical protein
MAKFINRCPSGLRVHATDLCERETVCVCTRVYYDTDLREGERGREAEGEGDARQRESERARGCGRVVYGCVFVYCACGHVMRDKEGREVSGSGKLQNVYRIIQRRWRGKSRLFACRSASAVVKIQRKEAT